VGAVPPIKLDAAHVIAVVDVALLAVMDEVSKGEHAPGRIVDPMIVGGELTDIGVNTVAAHPGLNIVYWQAGLATPAWRRYL
jgi:hypothetical protein